MYILPALAAYVCMYMYVCTVYVCIYYPPSRQAYACITCIICVCVCVSYVCVICVLQACVCCVCVRVCVVSICVYHVFTCM